MFFLFLTFAQFLKLYFMKRIFILALLSFCFVNLGFAQRSGVIDPELYDLMNSRSSDKISVNIILKDKIDANELNVRKSFSSKDAQRAYMINEMKYQAEKSQADILETLQAGERGNQVTDVNCHWLTNMINCNANADAINKIAKHPDVEAIIYNKLEKLIPDTKAEPASPIRGNTQNITQIQADKVWDLGFTGEGVIVAVIDTGVNTNHVDLKDHLWSDSQGRHGKNTLNNNYDITDNDGHGTHCAGTICGDGTSGTTTGMAPDATLMCIKALGDNGEGTAEAMVSAVEYAVENGADILSMSLGFSYPGAAVNEIMRELFSNTLTAGVVASVAAGNDGRSSVLAQYPVPRNINAPGSCPPPYLSPDQVERGGTTSVICIGAVNYSDVACDFSSQGPVSWENTSYADYPYGTAIPTTTLKYDNGNVGSYYTFTNTFAVKFPKAMLTGFGTGGNLSAVTIFDVAQTSGTFKIVEGGNDPSKGTQVHSQTFTLSASGDMIDIALNKTLKVNTAKDLWVVFELGTKVVPIASNKDAANGRWVYENNKWTNGSIDEMLAVRAKVTTSNAAETHYGLIRPDVVAPGYQIVSASNASNTGYATMSGTSMATPCAAGAMALLLDANSTLTPADICRVLEETSVKLTATKDNKTGTGRINIYDAVLSVAGDLPLSAPTLTATAASTSSINLSWTTAPGATSYTVYRGDSQIANNLTSTTYTDDDGLNPETQYCYTVKAIKGSETATSNESCATTLAEGAAPGTGKYRIKAVERSEAAGVSYYLNIENNTQHASGSKGGVGLATKADNDSQIFEIETIYGSSVYFKSATGYYIYCQQWNVDAYSTTTGTSLEMQDAGKGDNTFYIYSAKGYFKVDLDSGGSGKYYPYSDGTSSNRQRWILEEVTTSTPDPTPTVPNAPATLTATAQSTSVINLSWSSVAEATSYNVYRGLSKIANVATGTTYSDTGLNPGTEYCYTVTSVNDAGESTKMNEACATTLTAVTKPGAFNLTATAQSSSSIGLSWTASSGATSYDVYRAVQKVASGLTTTSYTDTGLSASTQYCYSIVAVNTAGQTESNQACATTQAENTGGGEGGVVEIGEQNSSTGMLPIASAYPTGFTQQIYTSDEINETNDMTGGMVTYIAFTQSNTISGTRNIEVYMQNTTKSSFTGSSNSKDWVAMPETYKVFEGNVTLPGQNKDLEIKLDIPFAYTGDNILISVWDKTDGYTNSNAQFYRYGTNYNRSIRIANWGATYNPANMGSVYGYLDGYNNVIKITFEAAETIIPVPQNVKATPANIFVDQSTTISWDACAGASSYNIYVDGVNRGSSNSTSYVLSNLQYNMNPGAKVTVTAIVDGEESEPSKEVVVKVGGYFPLVINVVDHLGNPMQGVTIDLDGYDEIGNTISQTYTSDANGSVSVAKMPLPLINNCYNLEAVKSIYTGYATICDYDNAYGDIIKDVEHVVTIVMELPSPMALYADKDTYAVGENIILTWDKVTSASPQGYNLYEKYWDDGSSSLIYEKINANLIPANTNTYTVVGGLPTRGCDNTICLTAVYTESETSKGKPSVTVAKTGTGTMAGIVVDENGNPISGVSVTVQGTSCDGSGSYEYTYTTGANGKFGENMPMGIYNVFATKPGSIYNDRSVFDIEIVHGEETEVIIEMWEKGDEYEIEREIGENPAPYIDYSGPVLPVSTGFLYSASQQIYLKEELNFASASDVKITSVSFRVYGNTNAGKQDTIRIFVQNTTKAEFATLKDWTQVYDDDSGFTGSYTMPSDGEWVTFNFAKPLEYTGGNLLVAAHRHAPALQQSGFYVCETETRRSLCGADDSFNPVNMQTDATALYKINAIKITYTTTSPEVVVNPNPIDFGEVIVGDYWTEKADATVPVQVKGYNTKVDAVTVDNPFFTMPALNLPQNILNFDMGYNRNNAPGYKAGVLTATPQKGLVKEVKVTATAYDPVEPDVFEKSREVVWVNDEYEDTPAFATLHDDYILPSETPEAEKVGVGTRDDAVYKFTLERDAYVTAMVYNGSNALLAFYKDDFANDAVDKDGPSYDNPYYGTSGAPTVETVDICILGGGTGGYEEYNSTGGTLPNWTFYNADGQYPDKGWRLDHASGWGGSSNANEKDWALVSETYYDSHHLNPENYVYTTAKYEITALSEMTFSHRYSDRDYWHDMFDVVISEDGVNFESVHHIEYTEQKDGDKWFLNETVSLTAYKGRKVHIGFMHKDKRGDAYKDYVGGVKIDDVCINNVVEVGDSRSNNPSVRASGQVTAIMENMLFPKGTYYAVPAAETEFTFYITKQDIDEGIIFIGQGDWKVPSNWNINAVPVVTDDVIIRGDAHVNDDVYINSIFIESVGTLTVEPTGTLDVIAGIENNLHSAFVIEDGGQVYQNAADVAATFNMNINNPTSWGPDGSHHSQGWQFIASPFLDADMLNYVRPDEGDYDLYKYDGTQHLEWVNYKLHHDEFSHDFAGSMQGWTSLDANNDGYSWAYNGDAGNDGAAGYLSCVFRQGKSNDYLVSPKIINTYPESKLRFWVKNASDVTTTNEVEVWLSADKAVAPTTADEFVTKVGTVIVTNEWQQVEFLLEAYADQDDRDFMEYWIAIRSIADGSSNTEVLVDKLELANYEEANPYETEFVLGRGYMASYEKATSASLQGVLNHERTFDYKVAFNADDRWENFYLIGNPFPFNIKWTDFTHSNIVNGFAVVDNDGSYVYDVNADIKVGDGIMIMTTGANPSVSVTKGNRNAVSDHINVVARGTEGDDNFIISLSGEEYAGYKKLENFNGEISTVYVSEYGTQYGIVNRDADVEEVEFCFDAKKMGYYTIDVILDGNYSSVTLYDRIENVETDMLSGNGYKFFALDARENYNRFVLRFSKKTDSDGGNFVYQSGDELVIDAEGLVQIIDVMGRIVYSGDQSGINRVNVNGLENSACVVRNINNNEIRTQKIVIL